MYIPIISLLLLSLLQPVISTTHQLHHRVVLPLAPSLTDQTRGTGGGGTWSKRGSLIISTSGEPSLPKVEFSLEGVESLHVMKRGEEDVDWKSVLESGWYQVALERDGVRAEEWARSGVRLCNILTNPPPSQILQISLSSSDSTPISISQSLYPSSLSSCPKEVIDKITDPASFEKLIASVRWSDWNVTVVGDIGYQTSSPNLQPSIPLQIDPITNQPIQQEPIEKTFIQKYWIYMAGGLLAVTLMLGGDEGAKGGKDGAGGGRR